jgi:hypothetical protein
MRTQKRKKINAVNCFGGCCQKCGYNKCMEALEFHHLEKNEKEESPSYVIMRWSWERAKKELEKCILLCANCHREIHAEESGENILDLRNYIKPWIDKDCNFCKNKFETKDEEQIYCTQKCSQFSQRKVERPSKEELNQLIDEKISWVQIGRMFNVSDNAVRKWAKSYKII